MLPPVGHFDRVTGYTASATLRRGVRTLFAPQSVTLGQIARQWVTRRTQVWGISRKRRVAVV